MLMVATPLSHNYMAATQERSMDHMMNDAMASQANATVNVMALKH